MLFGKLPVVFLSSIASENDDSTNCHIASYILGHLEDVKRMGISELAKNCHVSNSSISRFCKEIGLEDFIELKEILNDRQTEFERYSDKESVEERVADCAHRINNSIAMAGLSLDHTIVKSLCEDIYHYPRIAVFGLLKAGIAALSLQSDLFMLGKQVVTKMPFQHQIKYLRQAGRDDLVIIFSYTGVYFDYCSHRLPATLQQAKVYFITGNQGIRPNDYIDAVISFRSQQDQSSHPYQLQFVSSVIAQEYAHYLSSQNK